MSLVNKVESILSPLTSTFDSQLFLTQLYEPSKIYKADDLLAALSIVGNEPGVAGKTFYLGEESVDLGWEYGLVNLAAFLAQCMKETILYDACDENNWDLFNNQYPLSNSCGQLGQSYQDYKCSPEEEHMQCPVDPEMEITATTHATWYGAPPGLFCAPKTAYPHTGIWDYNYWCDCPWNDPPEYCDVYPGQKSGRFDNTKAVANMAGRTDVEGCCWWGRGVIQTTGVCNYGKLNYYLGAKAAQDGRSSRYPTIDFCKTPDKICSDPNYPELKWIAGFFYWIESVQSYDQQGWYYLTELHKFVNGGMADTKFIDSVSGIVNRGCHNPPCATGQVDGLTQRRGYFTSVLKALGLPSALSGDRPVVSIPQPSSAAGDSVGDSAGDSSINVSGQGSQDPTATSELSRYRDVIEKNVLSYSNLQGVKVQSDVYTFDRLLQSLSYAIDTGYAGEKKFYIDNMSKYGMINVAAFLAESMVESIQFNACEEFHLDSKLMKFPISNSCGQFGANYQDYKCEGWEASMECPINPGAFIEAVDGGKFSDERPSFYCKSTAQEPFTGVFDARTSEIYSDEPFPNSADRTDVEGCCFWGRGALMTKGPCMIGKLNYYMGFRAAGEGRAALYPNIDFCNTPEMICKNSATTNIAWDIALFEWVERIQSYNQNGWSYMEQLHQFVDGGMTDVSFINTVSEVVTGAVGSNVPFTGQRWANFNMLLTNLQLKGIQINEEAAIPLSNSWFIWSGTKSCELFVGSLLTTLLLVRFMWIEMLSW